VVRAVVIGVARSGVGAANLLAARGLEVTATDIRTPEELGEFTRGLDPRVRLVAGGHPERVFEGAELIVVSPGVPLSIEPLRRARAAGIEVIGELELAYREFRTVPWYAVTGTNGKSTTVTLLDLMLRAAGKRSLLGGNLGNALTAEAVHGPTNGTGPECIVAEVSSFQLEATSEFRATGAAVLNITADHLDRYPSMKEYAEAKGRISLNQRRGEGDFLVLNADDPECARLFGGPPEEAPGVFRFSRKDRVRGVFLSEGFIHFDIERPGRLIRADEVGIRGAHNLENAMAATLMALLAGCAPDAVAQALREFRGLEHRLEFVREVDGVGYINDSKGTNVGAVVKSLESFEGRVILIAGGRDKNGDFGPLGEAARGRVKAALLIGEAREKLRGALLGVTECIIARDLGDAVTLAAGRAGDGDVVLLSPACASFDMFRDFQHRGREFKRMVAEL
jgi:UDP-N-acetylmuramoylalanine--D-glutamate ligase